MEARSAVIREQPPRIPLRSMRATGDESDLIRPQCIEPSARGLVRPDAVVVFLRECERLAVVGLGLLGLGLALPGEAAARVGAGQPGIDADRRGVVGDGAVELALLAQLDRAVVV